jgi:hypothetical protein
MNKDTRRTILAGHYESSLDFRKGQGKDEITAMEPALRGPENVAVDPLSPLGEPLGPDIVAETADGIVAVTPDPDDENVRRCDHCGKPMKEGYYLGGEFACSDECALALYHGDKAQMDEDLSHADEADGECYWTEWDSVYFD